MVLIIGGEGRIGQRYQAVLNYLNVPFDIYEFEDALFQPLGDLDFEQAIICTPSDYHGSYVRELVKMNRPFLCEKPLSKNLREAEQLAILAEGKPGFVVNNWQFCLQDYFPCKTVTYDYFNTGPDGLKWDVCQLAYLANREGFTLTASEESPTWDVKVDRCYIAYREIERSYIAMIKAWLSKDYKKLWTIQEGLEMTKLISEAERHEVAWTSGSRKIH